MTYWVWVYCCQPPRGCSVIQIPHHHKIPAQTYTKDTSSNGPFKTILKSVDMSKMTEECQPKVDSLILWSNRTCNSLKRWAFNIVIMNKDIQEEKHCAVSHQGHKEGWKTFVRFVLRVQSPSILCGAHEFPDSHPKENDWLCDKYYYTWYRSLSYLIYTT